MFYDDRDLLVYTQDANMRVNNQWLSTFYDQLNRPVITGLVSYDGTPSSLQDIVNQTTSQSSSGPQATITLSGSTAGTYQATSSIEMVPDFQTTGPFIAEIISGSGNYGSNVEGVAVPGTEIELSVAINYL